MKISLVLLFKTKARARMLMVSWKATKKGELRRVFREISPLVPPTVERFAEKEVTVA